MHQQAMILTPVALLLAGSVSLAWSSAATGRSRSHRLLATEVLWIIAGLLCLGTAAITIVHMVTQPMAGTTIGDRITALFTGSIGALTAFVLLGYIGFWTRLNRRRSPTVVALQPEPGAWARVGRSITTATVVDQLPFNGSENSIDPMSIHGQIMGKPGAVKRLAYQQIAEHYRAAGWTLDDSSEHFILFEPPANATTDEIAEVERGVDRILAIYGFGTR